MVSGVELRTSPCREPHVPLGRLSESAETCPGRGCGLSLTWTECSPERNQWVHLLSAQVVRQREELLERGVGDHRKSHAQGSLPVSSEMSFSVWSHRTDMMTLGKSHCRHPLAFRNGFP